MTEEERRTSVDKWFRLHSGRVLAFLLHRADRETALDVLQDVYVLAFKKADEVPEPALGWLFAAARRLLANTQRSHRRRNNLLQRLRQQPAQPLGTQRSYSDASEGLANALRGLSDNDREVLTLSAWYGLTSAEAAQALGCSAGTYDVRLHRARRRLTDHLRNTATTSSGENPLSDDLESSHVHH